MADFDSSSEDETDFLQTSEKEHSIPTPGVSELTSVARFERRCRTLLERHPYEVVPPSEFVQHVIQKMGISESRVKALKEICNPEHMHKESVSSQTPALVTRSLEAPPPNAHTPEAPPPNAHTPEASPTNAHTPEASPTNAHTPEAPPPETPLLAHQTAEMQQLNFTKEPDEVLSYFSKCQEFSIALPNLLNKSVVIQDDPQNDPEEEQVQVADNSIVMWIDIFHPIKKVRDHGFIVLASQLLTELKDAILCPNDYMWTEDISDLPLESLQPMDRPEKNKVPDSAFFFINNTFYNDKRSPHGDDVIGHIIEWTKEKPDRIKLSPALDYYKTRDMQGVRFDQIEMRLGFPYLYSHGGCDHLLMVRDIRLFNPKMDVLYEHNYPRLVFCTNIRHYLCSVCEAKATWLTCDDELAPESPSFFCQDCFLKLHYNIDHEKMCEFKAYRYQVPDNPVLSTRQQ